MLRKSRIVLRLVAVAALAWFLWAFLDARELGWAVIPIALIATGLTSAIVYFRRRAAGSSREERWIDAVLDPAQRSRAIDEIREELGRLPEGRAGVARRASLSLILAELHSADRDDGEALAALDRVPLGRVDPQTDALVRHARAVILLRAGDAQAAQRALAERPKTTGDEELDLRLDLLEASIGVELGRADEALEVANRARRRAGSDESLIVEARVLRAAALDAKGARDEALDVLRQLGGDVIDMLAQLGQPRVRDLAIAVRGG